jgi:hypothetical protein
MDRPVSFNGIRCYRVIEVSKVEHVKIKKNIFTGKTKTINTQMENLKHEVLIVSSSKGKALELYKERYNCNKIGDSVIGWKGLNKKDGCVVMGVKYDVNCPSVVTPKELYENATIQDYVKYITFLNKGFGELINPIINYEKDE